MIRKLKSGQYRLYSRKKNPQTGKRRNLGTFTTRAAAEQHEREVQYFKKQYNIARMNPKQPLLEIRQKRGTIYLPPELCTMVGIPTVIREDFRAMSQIK